MGLAFAFGWTPCIGPILAAILAVAASEQTVTKGAGLLAVYSLGLGIPFIIAAFAIEPFAAFLARFRKYLRRVEQAMGALPGAHRHRVPHRQHQHDERVAAGGVSGAGQNRVTSFGAACRLDPESIFFKMETKARQSNGGLRAGQ